MKPHPEVEIIIMVRQQHGAFGQAIVRTDADSLAAALVGPTVSPEVLHSMIVPALLDAAGPVLKLYREGRR